jgi:SAM-dependent methyltransferase
MILREVWEKSRKFITEYTGKEPGTNGERNTTQYDIDKGSIHSYLETYHDHFNKYLGNPINILEIGISGGWSLYMWNQYFDKGSNVVGIDIDPYNLIWKNEDNRVKMIFSDINNTNKVNSELGDMKFDIIIDDGSHVFEDMANTFHFLYDRLNKGGTYVIEDVDGNYPDKVQLIMNKLSQYSPEMVDLRNVKGRYDDMLIIVKK